MEVEWDYSDLEMGEVVRAEADFRAHGKCLRCDKALNAKSWSRTKAQTALRSSFRAHIKRSHKDNIPIVKLA